MLPEEKYTPISDSTIELFNGIVEGLAFPFNVTFEFVCNKTQKCLIKISKFSDVVVFMTKKQILVQFNETYLDVLDDVSAEILIRQELDKLEFNANSGQIKLSKPELSTSVGVIKKFGIEKVAEANKLEELLTEQKADAKTDAEQSEIDAVRNSARYVASSIESDSGVDFI
jgi:hypothetical protein